jgi:hypothetical protein
MRRTLLVNKILHHDTADVARRVGVPVYFAQATRAHLLARIGWVRLHYVSAYVVTHAGAVLIHQQDNAAGREGLANSFHNHWACHVTLVTRPAVEVGTKGNQGGRIRRNGFHYLGHGRSLFGRLGQAHGTLGSCAVKLLQ